METGADIKIRGPRQTPRNGDPKPQIKVVEGTLWHNHGCN